MDGVLLGSGGWIPTSRRETCSLFLRKGRDVLLVDAGTGLQRLLEHPDLLDGAESVHIVLTHFHLDHVVGLAYIPGLPLARPPVVWAAGEMLTGSLTRAILERLLGPPLFSAPLESFVGETREISDGTVQIGPFAVSVRVQERHPEPTLALRIGDALTYCTDTAPDPANVAFATGSCVLLHEAWHAEDRSDDPGHSAAGDAARIARDAGAEQLVLIHVNPALTSDEDLARPALDVFAGSEVGCDLEPLSLP